MGGAVLRDLAHLRLRSDHIVVAEHVVESLRRERQEWSEHDLQVVDAAQRDVKDRARALLVGFDDVPRLLGAEVDVDLGGHRHRVLERVLKPRRAEVVCDDAEGSLDLADQSFVCACERSRPRLVAAEHRIEQVNNGQVGESRHHHIG